MMWLPVDSFDTFVSCSCDGLRFFRIGNGRNFLASTSGWCGSVDMGSDNSGHVIEVGSGAAIDINIGKDMQNKYLFWL